MPCVQKKRVFLPGYRRSVTRNWRPAYEGVSRFGKRSNLTLEEAAAYSGIGINKLRTLSDGEHCQFVLWVGSKRLIKRRKLDEYTERMYSL